MKLRYLLLLFVLPALAACGSEGGSESGSASSSSGSGDGSKWRVVYSGDLNGEVSGGIMSVAGIATNTMVAGAAMNEDSTAAADYEFRATITRYGDEPQASFTLGLPDGIDCSDVTSQDPEPSAVEISDPDSKTFRAEITGVLHCGPEKDQRIEFTAYLNADP